MKSALTMDEQPRFTSEQEFWTSPPSYPVDSLPPSAVPESERRTPSQRRLLLAKLLFATILSGVVVLLGYAVSLRLGISSARVGDQTTQAR
jgi:hypothetical protein